MNDKQPPEQRQARENSTPRKPRAPKKLDKVEPRSGTPQQVSALLARDWCHDFVVFQRLTDLLGSWERTREEMTLAVSTGKVRSIRYPSFTDGDPWNKGIINTEEFWRGRRYFRGIPGFLETGVAGGDATYVLDSKWVICLSIEDSCKRWPSLKALRPLQSLIDRAVAEAQDAKATTSGTRVTYDWEFALNLLGILIYEGKIHPGKVSVREATELLITEWAKTSDKTPELDSSEARINVGRWLRRYRERKTTD